FERMDVKTSAAAIPRLSHFERTLQIPLGGRARDSIRSSMVATGPAHLSLYLYVDEPYSTRLEGLSFCVVVNGRLVDNLDGPDLVKVRRVDTQLQDASEVNVEIRAVDNPPQGVGAGLINLHWGYLRVRPGS